MNSSGGLMKDGFALGTMLREYSVKAIVTGGQHCASACAVAFLGAVSRRIEHNGILLFHAPYIDGEFGKAVCVRKDSDAALALSQYYQKMLGKEDGQRVFARTMDFCSKSKGWTVNKDAADIFNITNSYSIPVDRKFLDKKALDWYKKAAEQGNAQAQYNLGWMYREGKGTAQDDKKAVYWWQEAAKQGSASAQSLLGAMYALGAGVPQDNIKAYMWANIAAANGDEYAKDILTTIMSRAAIEKAQAMASQCMASNYQNC